MGRLLQLEKAIKSCRYNCLGTFEIYCKPDPPLSADEAKVFVRGLLEQLQPTFTSAFDIGWFKDYLVIQRGLRIWCGSERKLQGLIKITQHFTTEAAMIEDGRTVYERKCRIPA